MLHVIKVVKKVDKTNNHNTSFVQSKSMVHSLSDSFHFFLPAFQL